MKTKKDGNFLKKSISQHYYYYCPLLSISVHTVHTIPSVTSLTLATIVTVNCKMLLFNS